MATANKLDITANFSPSNVDERIANDIVDTIAKVSFPSPKLFFELTKINDEIGYQITFHGDGWISDKLLEFTKKMYLKLSKKYRINILFLDEKGKVALKYSNENYYKTLLKFHSKEYILLPFVVFGCFFLCHIFIKLISYLTNSDFFVNLAGELAPFICYPISILAFGVQPPIMFTRIISYLIILSSAFAYYLFTGNGLWGSLILLVVFILNSVKESLT